MGYINVTYLRNDTLVRERSITLTSNVWCNLSNSYALIEEHSIPQKMEYNNKFNNNKILNNIISYDTNGVMLWHGKRCEATPATPEEQKDMEELLSRFKWFDKLLKFIYYLSIE